MYSSTGCPVKSLSSTLDGDAQGLVSGPRGAEMGALRNGYLRQGKVTTLFLYVGTRIAGCE